MENVVGHGEQANLRVRRTASAPRCRGTNRRRRRRDGCVARLAELSSRRPARARHGRRAGAATPAPVVEWLNREVVAVLRSPEAAQRLAVHGFSPQPMTPAAFRGFIQDETRKFAELLKTNHVSVERPRALQTHRHTSWTIIPSTRALPRCGQRLRGVFNALPSPAIVEMCG